MHHFEHHLNEGEECDLRDEGVEIGGTSIATELLKNGDP
jgi:hypothetical protein